MRILQISSSRTYGGGERHFVDLCRGLQGRGHEVFAALRPTNNWQERLDFLPDGKIFHVSIRNSFGILSASRMASFAKDMGIDVIHAHVARDYIPASIASTLSGRAKFVLTRHVLFPLKPFNRFALKNVSKAIAVSPGVARALKQIFPPKKVVVIPNGIDVREIDTEERDRLRSEFRSFHGIPPGAPLAGTMGELIPLKGHNDFILAANEIAARVPEARFIIVGRDNTVDKAHRRDLRRLVKVFGLEDRFLFLDWVDDTASFFAALDVFVSASRSESFGMAILEAMASGTAVLATETDGGRELISDERMRCPVNDPVNLAEKLAGLLADPEQRRQLADKLRIEARERFSLDQMVSRTEEVYLDL